MDLSTATVAVTGATGFIGRYLVRSLQARGARVVCAVRSPERAKDLLDDRTEARRADLSDRAALTRAFEGCDALLSNAAMVAVGSADRQSYLQTNVQGVDHVLGAAADAGCRRVVHVSSAVAYRAKPDHFYAEQDSLRDAADRASRLSYYAISKGAGERAAWRLADELGLELTTVRPHTVFGVGDRGTFTIWLERLMRSPLTVWPTHVALPSVYAADLAEAMCRALERPASAGHAYNIATAPDAVSYWDLMQGYRGAGLARARLVLPVPVPVRRRYDVQAAVRDLDFVPRPVSEAFADMRRLRA